ncbi:hypothetical protein BH11PSE11_BH11PSE11_12900 [soil metagenome]
MSYNRDMSQLDILLPFALAPEDFAADLLRELNAPALAMIVARAKQTHSSVTQDFSRALPHEICIAGKFGLDDHAPAASSPAIAAATARAMGHAPGEGVWFLMQPAHVQVGRDSMMLTDLRQLSISETESRALFDAIHPLFEEIGKPLVYGDAQQWFLRADSWRGLRTSTPDAAMGQKLDVSMPDGSGEREWRKLQNEVQMQWHEHAVNLEREARNLKVVNSVWLWGGGDTSVPRFTSNYSQTYLPSGWMDVFSRPDASRRTELVNVSAVLNAQSERGLLVLDDLIAPAIGSDWSTWLHQMETLEANWFAPLLDALSGKSSGPRIDKVSLILSHASALAEFSAGRNSLRKFWIKPSLNRLSA